MDILKFKRYQYDANNNKNKVTNLKLKFLVVKKIVVVLVIMINWLLHALHRFRRQKNKDELSILGKDDPTKRKTGMCRCAVTKLPPACCSVYRKDKSGGATFF